MQLSKRLEKARHRQAELRQAVADAKARADQASEEARAATAAGLEPEADAELAGKWYHLTRHDTRELDKYLGSAPLAARYGVFNGINSQLVYADDMRATFSV